MYGTDAATRRRGRDGKMNIVILDGYTENPGDLSWDAFRAIGNLTVYDRTKPEQTVERIVDAEILIVNKVRVTSEVLDACPKLQYIGLLSTGYDVINLAAATRRKIPMCNVPGYGTQPVA